MNGHGQSSKESKKSISLSSVGNSAALYKTKASLLHEIWLYPNKLRHSPSVVVPVL